MQDLCLTITNENDLSKSKLFFEKGESLLLLCQKNNINLSFACGGNGNCGKCKVQFLTGAPLPLPVERKWLSPSELRKGYRLACKVCLSDNCEIIVPKMKMDIINEGLKISWDECHRDQDGCFVAVDIGTTTIVMEKRRLSDGKSVAIHKAVNAQHVYGSNVISRLSASINGHREDLALCIKKQLQEGLLALGKDDVSFLTIAANTTMIHLLMGYDVSGLSIAPFQPVTLEEVQFEIDHIPAYCMPGFSAFVGGDIYAGMIAVDDNKNYVNKKERNASKSNMEKRAQDIELLIDLGTNAEMVIFNHERMVCTSAAAGSAFDAIADIDLYGADVVAIAYDLLKNGLIDEHGTIISQYFDSGIEKDVFGKRIVITQEHIREIQLAKAAVRCGIDYLTNKFGCRIEDIQKVYLAGGFGYYLDAEAAAGIGLLPKELKDISMPCGNTALAGAAIYGRNIAYSLHNESVSREVSVINLAEEPDFSEKYVQYLDF